MTRRWAFVPSAPLLTLPGDDVLSEVRAAAESVVRELLGSAPITVVAEHREPVCLDASAGGDLRRYGLDVRAGGTTSLLGLGHTIGAWLLDRAGWDGPRRYATDPDDALEGPVLVVADGTASVATESPRGLDPRGPGFQRGIVQALEQADTDHLAALDLELAAELWCSGAAVLRRVARAAGSSVWEAELRYADAPLGVGYWVASWRPR